MINYNPKSWFSLIFRFHKSDTFRVLLSAMFSVAIYAAAVAYVEIEILQMKYRSTTALHSLLGFVISLLLVFRTNTAYERWWEGRKLWGSLINQSRNLALKLDAFLPPGQESRERLAALISDYAVVLKEHLRNKKLPHLPVGLHQPSYITSAIMKETNALYMSKQLSAEQFLLLKDELGAFADICGACERIKKTPIPYSYSLFLKKFIFVYIMTMPFGFVTDFGYLIIPVVTLVFYVLASLELIAEEIEDPFGTDANDLPTDEIALAINDSMKQILIEKGDQALL